MTTPPPNPPDEGGPAEPPVTPPPPPEFPTPAPAGAGAPFTVGDAFNYGWKKFQENMGVILTAMVILFVLLLLVNWIGVLISGGFNQFTDVDDFGFGAFFGVGYLVFSLLSSLVALVIQAAVVRAALGITKGEKVDLNTFLSMDNMGQVILAAILLAIGTSIGFILCFIPGLIVAFFSQFTYHFIIDKGLPAFDAIKASFTLVNKNLGSVVGLFFASILAFIVGAILCGIGLIVAIPVTVIATAYAYRRLNGDTVAA
jgi:hypothetical protein